VPLPTAHSLAARPEAAQSQETTIDAQRMTRIGFAYNQKPELEVPVDESSTPDEEPPSTRRDDTRLPHAPAARTRAGGDSASPTSSARSLGAARHAAPAAPSDDDEYAEWDSAETIDAVADALGALGEVVRLEATPDFPERLRHAGVDIVFNIAEGLRGVNREAHVPAICEFYGIPYSGSDPYTLSLCLDKRRTKEVLSFHGVPTAEFALVESMEDLEGTADGPGTRHVGRGTADAALVLRPPSLVPSFERPLFVKPLHEGSSKGITERNLVRSPDELRHQVAFLLESYDQPVLVERFLPGREFTCAVLGNGREARVLPLVGMNFDALPDGALPIYGYEAKWVWDTREDPLPIFDCPAPIDDDLRGVIEDVVLRAYRVLGCRDWSRVDVRLDADGTPNVVEVNPLPGILPDPADNSCFPKAARAAGMSYDELIQSCLRHAAARNGVPLPQLRPARRIGSRRSVA
jgi:D-alanine-D-alanine ligase